MNDMSDTIASGTAITTYANSRMAVMERLHNGVRLNDYRLPTTAYQVDLLPADLFDRPTEEQSELIHGASHAIVYEGGLPVVEGRLYWEQFPWEPIDAYAKFTDYRRLIETYGYRSLNLLIQRTDSEVDTSAENRQIEELRQHYTYYAWGYRVKAFDMVGSVAYDRLRERRGMETENYHYLQLDKVFKKVMGHWDRLMDPKDGDPDPWMDVGIVDMVKIMKDVMGLQRVAAGLPAANPLTAKEAGGDPNRGQSMETRLRAYAKQQALLEDGSQSRVIDTDALLKDPDMLRMAQALILSSQRGPDTAADEGVDASDEAAQSLEDSRRIAPQVAIVPVTDKNKDD